MAGIKDMEMPAPAGAPEGEEEFDFGEGFESEGSEDSAGPDLTEVSDDILIEEMKKRGFEVEDEPEETGEMGEEESVDAPEMEEPIV